MAETKERDPEAIRRGATIKGFREAYGVPAAKLAPEVGITRRYLSYIEKGDKLASVVLCRKVADYLGIALAAITVAGYDKSDDDANGSAA